MHLEKFQINKIEDAIFKSSIPYEDVKVELVDHLATMVELKMEDHPESSFEQALSIASIHAQESILRIRDSIRMSTLHQMIKSTYDFSNLMNLGILFFWSSMTYIVFLDLGHRNAPIIPSFLILSFCTLVCLFFRIRRVRPRHNYKLEIMKRYAWVPLICSAGFGLMVCCICIFILNKIGYSSFINYALYIPVALAYGVFMKSIMDVLYFNVHTLKEGIEINDIFRSGDLIKEWG